MSNEVYGYLEWNHPIDSEKMLTTIQQSTNLGIERITIEELYNFPEKLLPADKDKCLPFIIGDRPGKTNSTYLIDYLDYAPEADIGLPVNGKERLMILLDFLKIMFVHSKCDRFVVAITDSSQIEESKVVSLDKMNAEIMSDFEQCAPPDCVYEIVKET
ncbi:MAG: hypothetical protein OEZ39_11365 [Gammaproteobacteria bacterium]|nr:hypothetical protein [Gammaproteobacteria bacterium]MDH5652441.1 hypothetical protein [Gammaproteobacteria bacterium]